MPSRPRVPLYFHAGFASVPAGVPPLFTHPSDYRAFEAGLRDALAPDQIRVVAYCVMPTHWRLVAGPTDPATLAGALGRCARAHPIAAGGITTRPLATVNDVVLATRDVEREALTRGLVRRAQDWPWSSLAGRLDPDAPLPLVHAPFLSSRAWVDYINTPRPRDGSHHIAERPRRLA